MTLFKVYEDEWYPYYGICEIEIDEKNTPFENYKSFDINESIYGGDSANVIELNKEQFLEYKTMYETLMKWQDKLCDGSKTIYRTGKEPVKINGKW